jgi:hypothetical protein
MRFPKGSGGGVRIRRIDAPSGEGDLAGMGAEMLPAYSQQHAGLLTLRYCDKNGRWAHLSRRSFDNVSRQQVGRGR